MGSDDEPFDTVLRALARAPEIPVDPKVAHFRLAERIGQGGMGVVHRARDEKLGRDVALKLLPPGVAGDADRRKRFLREARAAAAVTHPNIVTVFEVGEAEDGRVFIAMELVSGESLRARLTRGALPADEALRVGLGVARGLAKAHAAGLVHRDLKPDNVMVTTDGLVKVLDFGLAKPLRDPAASPEEHTDTQVTETGAILGTPAYMSPEQATGKPLDARSDVFAFGVLLYELLSGKAPFTGGTGAELIVAIARDQPAPLRRVPDLLANVVAHCMKKAPSDRYRDGAELLGALERMTVTPARSRRSVLAAVAIGAAAALAIGVTARTKNVAPTTTTPSSAPATSASTARRGTALIDAPPPSTDVPAAAAEYAAALRAFRDGAAEVGMNGFVRAAKLDPAMAAANLRIVLYSNLSGMSVLPTQMRAAFAAASRFRASLSARDTALLHAAEAQVAEPPDFRGYADRMRAATARFPDDAETSFLLSVALTYVDRLDEARDARKRARELDPDLAVVDSEAGYWAFEMGDGEGARAAYDACLARSPLASACLRRRAELRDARGECADMEADARRLTQIEPNNPRAWEFLGRALAARNAPVESIRAALDRMVAVGAEVSPLFSPAVEALWLSFLVGDLTSAEHALQDADRALAGESSETWRGEIGSTLAYLAEERGDAAAAREKRDALAKGAAAWVSDAPTGSRRRALYAAHRAGRLNDDAFVAARDTLFHEAMARVAPPTGSFDADWNFISVYVEPAETKAEMDDAVARLAARGPVNDQWGNVGSLYLRTGDYARAAPLLRHAASRCEAMAQSAWAFAPTTLWWLTKHRDLGDALAGLGDKDGACTAYELVLDRWKDPKPRSRLVDGTRARAKKLGCAASSK